MTSTRNTSRSAIPVIRLLLADADGLVPDMVLLVAELADRAEAIGSDIADARVDMATADSEILTAAAQGRLNHAAFQSLCRAYEKIMFGEPQAQASPR